MDIEVPGLFWKSLAVSFPAYGLAGSWASEGSVSVLIILRGHWNYRCALPRLALWGIWTLALTSGSFTHWDINSPASGFNIYSKGTHFVCFPIKIRSHLTYLKEGKWLPPFNGPHCELLVEVLTINLSVTHKTAINMIFIIQNEPHQPFPKSTPFV